MTGKHFIVAGNLIDGSGGEVRRQVYLGVRDGIIAEIGSDKEMPLPRPEQVVDLSHCNILPPLVDCSVSLSRSPSVDQQVRQAAADSNPEEKNAMLLRHLGYCHAYGVLGVADSDDLSGLAAGSPDIYTEGGVIELRSSGGICRSRDDSPTGGDYLKIDYSGNIEDREAPHLRLNAEDLTRLLRNLGDRKAVVVANGRRQVAEALAAGCNAIEQGYDMGEANLREMAKKRVLWIPGAVRARNGLDGSSSGGDVACRFSTRYVAPGKPDPGAEAFWKKTLADQLAQLRLARKLGVTTAIGTGAGSVGILHGESMVEEMKLFIKAGYSLEETIRCASVNGANFFGMKKLGSISVGQPATFLVTRGSVQQLPRKLAYLEGIYINGLPSSSYSKNPNRDA